MATQGPETMIEAEDTITRGTSNVFADPGYADAHERQTKPRLAHAINGVIGRRWPRATARISVVADSGS